MALENIAQANLNHRRIIAGLFGLVHGFGFSYALKDQLEFAGSHLLASLFSFNVGIELGQLAVLCVAVPVLGLLFRGVLAGRMGVILVSAIVAHTAWHWMIDRWNVLWLAPWPQVTAVGLTQLARWVAGILLAAGFAKLVAKWISRKVAFHGDARHLNRSGSWRFRRIVERRDPKLTNGTVFMPESVGFELEALCGRRSPQPKSRCNRDRVNHGGEGGSLRRVH